jgi:hypothetical protein
MVSLLFGDEGGEAFITDRVLQCGAEGWVGVEGFDALAPKLASHAVTAPWLVTMLARHRLRHRLCQRGAEGGDGFLVSCSPLGRGIIFPSLQRLQRLLGGFA